DISDYELSYVNMLTNQVLSDEFTKNLKEISPRPVNPAEKATGPAHMRTVSQVVPSIHRHIGLNDENLVLHTIELPDRTITEDGRNSMSEGVLALAKTGYDVITDENLLASIKKEFEG